METVIDIQPRETVRSTWGWFVPVQAAVAFTVFAVAAGGQVVRTGMLSALVWLMAMPLFVGLEASLIAMMIFEPVRGVARRAQYLIVEYSSQDPIHLLTPIVTIFAFALLLKTHRLGILRATPLASCVSVLGAIYFVEIFNPLQGGLVVGLGGAMFVLIPLLWFYFGLVASEKFINRTLCLIVCVGLIASVWGIYQLVFGYPAFEQYWIDNTEFYNSIAEGKVERALATFSSAEEWSRYVEVGAIIAFGFSAARRRLIARAGWLAIGGVLIGFVALTAQRAAVFGLLAGLVVLVVLGAQTLLRGLGRLTALAIPFVLLIVFMPAPSSDDMWSKDESQTIDTVLSHTQRGVLKPAEEGSFQERLKNWTYLATQVIPYRPLGEGIGAGSLSESKFAVDAYDLPPIDSSIFRNAVSCGIPGLLLFVWILWRAIRLSWWNARRGSPTGDGPPIKRIVAAVIAALVVNSMFGMAFTLYAVAPIAWLLIGWTSAEARRAHDETEREIITI